MPLDVSLVLSPVEAAEENVYVRLAAEAAGVGLDRIALVRIVRRSVDARRGKVRINLTVRLYVDDDGEPEPVNIDYPDVSHAEEVAVVGAGPAGLFAALRLIERGIKPVVFERGKKVAERKKDIATINRNGPVDPDSNYAFGEGGAGTFSDGKLYTRSKKRGDYNKALNVLVAHGAPEEILYDTRPHIGTDKLPGVISRIRGTIEKSGGRFVFGAKVDGLLTENGNVKGITFTRTGNITDPDPSWSQGNPGNGEETFECRAVVMATGHSARDIYTMLHLSGVRLEAKSFAMGVRIEHPQELIDSIQYHGLARGEYLPAASYSLVTQVGDRGVYSFCMCPGGFIVPAMTDSSEIVVNGMSPSDRNSPFANSGIVTEVRQSDYAHLKDQYGELAGMVFQQNFEHAARRNGGGQQVAPALRVADFVSGRQSSSLPKTSYVPGIIPSGMEQWLPGFMASSLKKGISDFGRKMKGFVTNDAVVIGVESRTSTPVRIPRDPVTLQHPQTSGLYPCGEGAGYAGGIISAALDGEKVADAVAIQLK